MKKLYRALVYILPAVLFFSYHPVISLGQTESMYLELSIPLIWLVLFDGVSFVQFVKERPKLNKNLLYLLPFLIFLAASILWSPNKLRAILTVGMFILIVFAILSLIFLKKNLDNKLLVKFFLGSTIFVCAWCWLQSLIDLIGVGREVSLMCVGCTSEMFGFPHPNGFAIEPQFMGNLLLAPALYIIYMLVKKPSKKLYLLGFFVIATLFLTFSRGAIYSFAVALFFMLVALGIKEKSWKCLKTIPLVLVAFLFTLNAQGIFAAASKTNDTYFSGISKSLNQLSLGIIDISEKPSAPEPAPQEEPTKTQAPESAFDGYVEESTNTRLRLSDQALKIWQQDAGTMLVGVGVGGAGTKLFENGYSASPREIVQNEIFELLLELGLIGCALLIPAAVLIFKETKKNKSSIFLFSLYIAFGLSFMFFSGLPNALHIFLLPALMKTKDDIITL